MLPRIKYRNPALPIQINRHNDKLGPSVLEIYTSKPGPEPTSAPEGSQDQPVDPASPTAPALQEDALAHTIDLRMIQESEILAQLIARTGATVLKATEQEMEELAEMAVFKEQSEKDRVEVREKLMAQRREAELMRLARGEVPEAK